MAYLPINYSARLAERGSAGALQRQRQCSHALLSGESSKVDNNKNLTTALPVQVNSGATQTFIATVSDIQNIAELRLNTLIQLSDILRDMSALALKATASLDNSIRTLYGEVLTAFKANYTDLVDHTKFNNIAVMCSNDVETADEAEEVAVDNQNFLINSTNDIIDPNEQAAVQSDSVKHAIAVAAAYTFFGVAAYDIPSHIAENAATGATNALITLARNAANGQGAGAQAAVDAVMTDVNLAAAVQNAVNAVFGGQAQADLAIVRGVRAGATGGRAGVAFDGFGKTLADFIANPAGVTKLIAQGASTPFPRLPLEEGKMKYFFTTSAEGVLRVKNLDLDTLVNQLTNASVTIDTEANAQLAYAEIVNRLDLISSKMAEVNATRALAEAIKTQLSQHLFNNDKLVEELIAVDAAKISAYINEASFYSDLAACVFSNIDQQNDVRLKILTGREGVEEALLV